MQINTEKYSKLTNTEYVTFKGLQLTQPQKQNPDNGKNMSWSDNCQSRILYYGRLQFKNKGMLFFSPSYEKNTSKKQFKESFDFGSRFEEIHLIIAGR